MLKGCEFTCGEGFERGWRSAQQPGQHVGIADEVVRAVVGGNSPQGAQFMGSDPGIVVAEPRLKVGVGIDLFGPDVAPHDFGENSSQIVGGVTAIAHELLSRAGMLLRIA